MEGRGGVAALVRSPLSSLAHSSSRSFCTGVPLRRRKTADAGAIEEDPAAAVSSNKTAAGHTLARPPPAGPHPAQQQPARPRAEEGDAHAAQPGETLLGRTARPACLRAAIVGHAQLRRLR